jgi:hypothetical protein
VCHVCCVCVLLLKFAEVVTLNFLENDKIKVQQVIKKVVELVSSSHGLSVPLQYKLETLCSVKNKYHKPK